MFSLRYFLSTLIIVNNLLFHIKFVVLLRSKQNKKVRNALHEWQNGFDIALKTTTSQIREVKHQIIYLKIVQQAPDILNPLLKCENPP